MNEQRIFDFFAGKGFTAAGIFGMLGNIRDESGGNPGTSRTATRKSWGTQMIPTRRPLTLAPIKISSMMPQVTAWHSGRTPPGKKIS